MVAEEFSSFFENAIKSLNISLRNLTLGDTTNLSNPVEIAIKKFENQPSVQIIGKYSVQASIDDILKEMENLDNKKKRYV